MYSYNDIKRYLRLDVTDLVCLSGGLASISKRSGGGTSTSARFEYLVDKLVDVNEAYRAVINDSIDKDIVGTWLCGGVVDSDRAKVLGISRSGYHYKKNEIINKMLGYLND